MKKQGDARRELRESCRTPTTGQIKVKGRIASLLEVGTGFHPELTGRENIFLNGAILGMCKAEIAAKFDEIVDFSGCERYIDTPVRRNSSGMYVRLAFAVAAHLEPEILIVDEVLAVGDAEFQKKCIGKMKDVAGQGRTVLFVSHKMSAVQSLCQRALLLAQGRLAASGPVGEMVVSYLKEAQGPINHQEWEDPATAPGNDLIRIKRVRVLSDDDLPDDLLTMHAAPHRDRILGDPKRCNNTHHLSPPKRSGHYRVNKWLWFGGARAGNLSGDLQTTRKSSQQREIFPQSTDC